MVVLFGPPILTQYRHPLFVHCSRIPYPGVDLMVSFPAAARVLSSAICEPVRAVACGSKTWNDILATIERRSCLVAAVRFAAPAEDLRHR
jgi:hypothetical protein